MPSKNILLTAIMVGIILIAGLSAYDFIFAQSATLEPLQPQIAGLSNQAGGSEIKVGDFVLVQGTNFTQPEFYVNQLQVSWLDEQGSDISGGPAVWDYTDLKAGLGPEISASQISGISVPSLDVEDGTEVFLSLVFEYKHNWIDKSYEPFSIKSSQALVVTVEPGQIAPSEPAQLEPAQPQIAGLSNQAGGSEIKVGDFVLVQGTNFTQPEFYVNQLQVSWLDEQGSDISGGPAVWDYTDLKSGIGPEISASQISGISVPSLDVEDGTEVFLSLVFEYKHNWIDKSFPALSVRSDLGLVVLGENIPPIADFSASPKNGPIPLDVVFIDQSEDTDGEIVRWQWDFNNDGSIDSESQSPTYTYSEIGEYSVSLTVTDDRGDSDTQTKENFIVATEIETPITSDIVLHQGWNVISTPFKEPLTLETIKDVCDIDEKEGLTTYSTLKDWRFVDKVSSQEGAHVKLNEPSCVISLQGTPHSFTSQEVYLRWNIISSPEPLSLEQIKGTCSLDPEETRLWRWDSLTQEWRDVPFDVPLDPNQGYWLRVPDSCELRLEE